MAALPQRSDRSAWLRPGAGLIEHRDVTLLGKGAALPRDVLAKQRIVSANAGGLDSGRTGKDGPLTPKEGTRREMAEPRMKQRVDLAFESGFNSKASFYRVFRQAHDTTPSAYRKNLLG